MVCWNQSIGAHKNQQLNFQELCEVIVKHRLLFKN